MRHRLKEYNFVFLFVGLLLLLLLEPIWLTITAHHGSVISGFAFEMMLIIGIWGLVESKFWFRAGLGLAVFALATSVLAVVSGNLEFRYASMSAALLFCGISAFTASQHLIHTPRIGLNEIMGSACIYMLLGVIWTLIYIFVVGFEPDAFGNLSISPLEGEIAELLYYSFVTLTTLGYGHIIPVSPLARVLASLEAIAGQLYLAILVAGLVGRYLAGERAGTSGSDD